MAAAGVFVVEVCAFGAFYFVIPTVGAAASILTVVHQPSLRRVQAFYELFRLCYTFGKVA